MISQDSNDSLSPKKEKATFILVDNTFLKKVRPYQNLAMIIGFSLLLATKACDWLEGYMVNNLAVVLLLISLTALIAFVFLSAILVLRNKFKDPIKGFAVVNNDVLCLQHQSAEVVTIPLNEVLFTLNIDKYEREYQELSKDVINSLPLWGNYIEFSNIGTAQVKKIEFEPNPALLDVISYTQIAGLPERRILMFDTAKAFNDVIWTFGCM